MKILHIIPSFYPAHVYGGAVESVYQLCRNLTRHGCELRVLTTDANGLDKVLDIEKGREVELCMGLRVRYCKRLIGHSVSPMLLRLLPSYILWADVVHLTAVYSFPTIPALLVCKVLGKPVVWSPRGALQRWEGSTRPTLKFLWERICRLVLQKRFVLHVTSEDESRESQKCFPGVDIAVIPNAIEIPDNIIHIPGNGTFRLLYLGRLHPKKGIENLLSACKRLKDHSDLTWSLTLAGTGDPQYVETLRTNIEELKLGKQLQMVGAVEGKMKQNLFENSDAVVVPSHTENFGMVVAEAMAHGVPVIASKGTPWRRVEEMGCGMWVDNDPESLAKAIEQMSQMPLFEMGRRGREWMEKEFSWSDRAQDMMKLYETLARKN